MMTNLDGITILFLSVVESLNPLNKYMGAISHAARSLHDRPSSSPSINPSVEDGK